MRKRKEKGIFKGGLERIETLSWLTMAVAIPAVPSSGTSSSTLSTETTKAVGYLPPIQPQHPSNIKSTSSQLSEWGTTARILRLVKPLSSLSQSEHNDRNPFTMVRRASTRDYLVTLHGLTRVKLVGASDATPSRRSPLFTTLFLHKICHASASPPDSEQIDPASLANFKQSALNLLDRLARDSAQKAKREAFVRIAEILDDLDIHSASSESVSRAAWMADTLVGSVVNDYSDKLGKLFSLVLTYSI